MAANNGGGRQGNNQMNEHVEFSVSRLYSKKRVSLIHERTWEQGLCFGTLEQLLEASASWKAYCGLRSETAGTSFSPWRRRRRYCVA